MGAPCLAFETWDHSLPTSQNRDVGYPAASFKPDFQGVSFNTAAIAPGSMLPTEVVEGQCSFKAPLLRRYCGKDISCAFRKLPCGLWSSSNGGL